MPPPRSPCRALVIALGLLLALPVSAPAGNVYQCRIHNTLTFQDKPCPAGAGQRGVRNYGNLAPAPHHPDNPPVSPSTRPQASPYHCDGRTRCGQMTSCAEARFFLANCPNTQMDGDRDGQPCEREWCQR